MWAVLASSAEVTFEYDPAGYAATIHVVADHAGTSAGNPSSDPPAADLRLHTKKHCVYTYGIYIVGACYMSTARVFRSGNSQAVRLPKQFRLKSKEVEIFRRGDEIVLREKDGNMVRAFDLLAGLPDDLVVVAREKDQMQKRKRL